jgi:hypothetical protein
MGVSDFTRRRASRSFGKVWALAKEHIPGAVVAVLASIVVFPILAIWGDAMHEALNLFLFGILGPCLLFGLVFLFFWVRAPAEMHADSIAEIRSLRTAQGMATDDLDLPKSSSGSYWPLIRIIAMYVGIAAFGYYVFTDSERSVRTLDNVAATVGADSRNPDNMLQAARVMETAFRDLVFQYQLLCARPTNEKLPECNKKLTLTGKQWQAITPKNP